MNNSIFSEYIQVLNTLKHREWTSFHTILTILLVLLVGACIVLFWLFSCQTKEHETWFDVVAILLCVITIVIGILFGIQFSMPYFMRRLEDDRNRENKMLSLIQEEYEQDNLAEKTRIGILEKYAKANIEEIVKDAESHRQLESRQQDYQTKIAEITLDLYKAYCSAQSPQALSDQQIVSQLINLLTRNNR